MGRIVEADPLMTNLCSRTQNSLASLSALKAVTGLMVPTGFYATILTLDLITGLIDGASPVLVGVRWNTCPQIGGLRLTVEHTAKLGKAGFLCVVHVRRTDLTGGTAIDGVGIAARDTHPDVGDEGEVMGTKRLSLQKQSRHRG